MDPGFRFIGRTSHPLRQFPGQPPTGTLQIKVQAANEAGHGVASDPAEIDLADEP